MKKQIMKKAWEIRKSKKYDISMSDCLKLAWFNYKFNKQFQAAFNQRCPHHKLVKSGNDWVCQDCDNKFQIPKNVNPNWGMFDINKYKKEKQKKFIYV